MSTNAEGLARPCPPYFALIGWSTGASIFLTSAAVSSRDFPRRRIAGCVGRAPRDFTAFPARFAHLCVSRNASFHPDPAVGLLPAPELRASPPRPPPPRFTNFVIPRRRRRAEGARRCVVPRCNRRHEIDARVERPGAVSVSTKFFAGGGGRF